MPSAVNIGTPSQTVFLEVDTGSDDIWVNPNCAYAPQGQGATCAAAGAYDPAESSTFTNLSTPFSLGYAIGQSNGYWGTETISLPGYSNGLPNVQFGVATNSSDIPAGIVGVGWGVNLDHNNIIDDLYLDGVTQLRAFSLILGAADQNQSGIIFGGVDTKKFSGPLVTVPNLPPQAGDDRNPVNNQTVSR
jgi:hypothetical protein